MQEEARPEVLECDLCIVGAGYAALNGLNVAAKYLKRGERVVVIDRRNDWGGQWRNQYDFVRLHAPYRVFTAGDQKWRLPGRDRQYLATRREVLDNLASVPARSAGHLEIETLFHHEYRAHRVRSGVVEIDAAPLEASRAPSRIRAKRLLKGTGFDIEILEPFAISSRRVRSVGIADPVLTTPEFLDSEAPVYVIGSGKTAMDCIAWLARQTHRRPRRVAVVIGSGMWFAKRDVAFPTGLSRFIVGAPLGESLLKMAVRFDGKNEAEVIDSLARENEMFNVFGEAGNYRFGTLSTADRSAVLSCVDEIIRGHLVDVDGVRMYVRGKDGSERRYDLAEGSWLINCTTHLRERPHEPLLQDGGLVCAPQHSIGFTGASAYFMTHLWFRDELAALADRLYRIKVNLEPKLRFATQASLAMVANLALVMDRLPLSVLINYEGDVNKYYPLHRQLMTATRMLARRRAVITKADRLLSLRFSDLPAKAREDAPSTRVDRRATAHSLGGG